MKEIEKELIKNFYIENPDVLAGDSKSENKIDKRLDELSEVFEQKIKVFKTADNLFLYDEDNFVLNDKIKSDLEMFKKESDIIYIRKDNEGRFSWVHLDKIMNNEDLRLKLGLNNPKQFEIEKENQRVKEGKLRYIGKNKYHLDYNYEYDELKEHKEDIKKDIDLCRKNESKLNKTIQAISTQFGLLSVELIVTDKNRFLYDRSTFDIKDIMLDLNEFEEEDDVIIIFKTGDNEYRCNYLNMLWRIKMHHDLLELARLHQREMEFNKNRIKN